MRQAQIGLPSTTGGTSYPAQWKSANTQLNTTASCTHYPWTLYVLVDSGVDVSPCKVWWTNASASCHFFFYKQHQETLENQSIKNRSMVYISSRWVDMFSFFSCIPPYFPDFMILYRDHVPLPLICTKENNAWFLLWSSCISSRRTFGTR